MTQPSVNWSLWSINFILCLVVCVCRQRQDLDIAATMQSDELRKEEELRKRQVCVVDILLNVITSCCCLVTSTSSSCHMHSLYSKRTSKWQLKYTTRQAGLYNFSSASWIVYVYATHSPAHSPLLPSPLLPSPHLFSPPLTSSPITSSSNAGVGLACPRAWR